MKHTALLTIGLFTIGSMFLPTTTTAQDSDDALRRLDFLIGEWSFEIGNGTTGVDRCEWFGRAYVMCKMDGTYASGGSAQIVGFWGYDPQKERYTWNRYWSNGRMETAVGWINGVTWTFVLETSPVRVARVTITEDGDSRYHFRWDQSVEGGDWTLASQGTAEKGN
jgi:hypothetical protein